MDLFKVHIFRVATGDVRLNELKLTIIIFHTFTQFILPSFIDFFFKKKCLINYFSLFHHR